MVMITMQANDAYVRHQIGLQRLATGTVRKIAKHLATVQADIAAQAAKDLTRSRSAARCSAPSTLTG